MRKSEKDSLLKNVFDLVKKKGMPMNIRDGSNETIAEWVRDRVDAVAEIEEPTGTETLESGGKFYDACPACRRVVGTSGKYCKWCGQLIRK